MIEEGCRALDGFHARPGTLTALGCGSAMLAAFGTWGGWAALTAIGTVGAVLVAVGQQWWSHRKERSARPRLTLQFDAHKRANEVGPDGTLIPYLRMAVTNAPGKETAADVEILILDVQEFGTGPVGSGGRQVWLANPALGWANSLDPVPRMTIPPGATRYVDVGRWLHDIPLSFVLRVVPEPGKRQAHPHSGRLARSAGRDGTEW